MPLMMGNGSSADCADDDSCRLCANEGMEMDCSTGVRAQKGPLSPLPLHCNVQKAIQLLDEAEDLTTLSWEDLSSHT